MGTAFLKYAYYLLLVIVVGCSPQATPVAPVVASPLPVEEVSTAAPFLRYGVTSELMHWLPDSIRDMRLLVEAFDGSQDVDEFDLLVAYGSYEGWQQAPVSHESYILLNPMLPPFDQAAMRDLFSAALDSRMIAAQSQVSGIQATGQTTTISPSSIREQLANLGYPDGISFTLISEQGADIAPIVNTLATSGFQAIQIMVTTDEAAQRFSAGYINAGFVITAGDIPAEWSTGLDERIALTLYSIPISYWAKDGVTVTFLENGLPIPAR